MNILKDFSLAFTGLGKRGQHNWIKLLCLGVGLAAGFVLLAKVYFEQSYNASLADADRIYLVYENYSSNEGPKIYPQTSGGIAPGIRRYAPQVESATRTCEFYQNATLWTENNKELSGNVRFADSCFFDVFPRKLTGGDPHEILSRPGYCLINKRLADAMGGNVIGQKIRLQDAANRTFYIGGVFEDFPLNSNVGDVDMLVPLASIGQFFWDGSQNWVGNDNYSSYIKLKPGTSVDGLKEPVRKMVQENFPLEEMKKAGVTLDFSYQNLLKVHTSDKSVQRMSWILSLLAFILLFSTVMNYLLVVVGGISRQAKEMAVRKCYGAGTKDIYVQVFVESFVHLLLSICVAALLLFACKGTIQELVSVPLSVLIFNKGCWLLVVVCMVVLLFTGLVPGQLYASIPVTSAFKGYTQTHHRWKLLLLGVQFAVAGFLFCLLFVIGRQYNLMVNDNPGFDYRHLVHVETSGLKEKRLQVVQELKRLPGVEGITSGYDPLIYGSSGDNISLPGQDYQLMNVADLYDVSDDYYKVMGIKVLQGRGFTEQSDSLREMMVSQLFVEKMDTLAHWKGNIVGRQVCITGHDTNKPFTIVGVYDNVRLGSIDSPDDRASIMTYSKKPQQNIFIRFGEVDSKAILAVSNKMKELLPDMSFVVESYKTMITNQYADSYRFRNTVMLGGIVTLLVALVGLVGYTNDEINRRHREIAVRKVNGAEVKDILQLFMKDVLYVALPALAVGAVGAYIVAAKWLEQFSEKITLDWWLFAGSTIAVLVVLLAVVNINCYKVANSNPVGYLKGNE